MSNPKNIAMAVKLLCVMQLVLALCVVIGAFYTTDFVAKFRNFVVGFVALVSAVVGAYGANQYHRGALLFFFITQVWGLSSVTNYLYSGVKEEQANRLYCKQLNIVDKLNSGNQDLTEAQCSRLEAIATLKMICAIAAVFVSWFSSYFALRLNERIQEADADLTRTTASNTLKVLPVSSD